MGLFDTFKRKKHNCADIFKIDDKNDFVIKMSAYINEKCNFGENMSALSDQERTFFITQSLEVEVNNGGFSQFLYNSSGDFANEAQSAFEKIGALKTAGIVKKALSVFDRPMPCDPAERQHMLDKADPKTDELLAECDKEFYRYTDDLTSLNYRFVMDNKQYFS